MDEKYFLNSGTNRGKIIVFEGIDCSGKETQTKILFEKLRSERVLCEMMSFPQYGTPMGDIVGECYLGKNLRHGDGSWFGDADSVDPKIASLLYAGDRRAAVPKINKILDSGTHLLLNRYYQSNMGHQGCKISSVHEREQMFFWLQKLEIEMLEIPREDATIFLYMPINVAIELMKIRDLKKEEVLDSHESNIEHLKRAEETYLYLEKFFEWKRIDCALDGTIKSLRAADDISDEIYKYVMEIISQ